MGKEHWEEEPGLGGSGEEGKNDLEKGIEDGERRDRSRGKTIVDEEVVVIVVGGNERRWHLRIVNFIALRQSLCNWLSEPSSIISFIVVMSLYDTPL
ncbi:hypothetical protein ACH5RR_008631 [Cinchona calisaya]|uniref:Uncharacterized protein n=1 Tax=Cinchona calisaya TaxID=153742 RepID=A0ABD3ADN1_9GENT